MYVRAKTAADILEGLLVGPMWTGRIRTEFYWFIAGVNAANKVPDMGGLVMTSCMGAGFLN